MWTKLEYRMCMIRLTIKRLFDLKFQICHLIFKVKWIIYSVKYYFKRYKYFRCKRKCCVCGCNINKRHKGLAIEEIWYIINSKNYLCKECKDNLNIIKIEHPIGYCKQ